MPTPPPAPDVRVDYLGFRESGQFAARDVAYAEQDPALRPFMAHAPTVQAFAKTIETRREHPVDRATLVQVLREQYDTYGLDVPDNVTALLSEDAFTVTTAHQASLFLGPLYYVYKILSAVALARQLGEVYPELRIVPVFVLGAEDHDLEEINHVRVGGERVTWRTRQTGATGQMSLADLEEARETVATSLGRSQHAGELRELLERCYRPDRTLGVATAHFVAELFGPYGVVVANLNDARLKRNFAPHIRREVLERASEPVIAGTVGELEAAGYAQQAHARAINFFYLQPGRRDRLVVAEDGVGVEVLDTELRWADDAAVAAEIEAHPERFSPNVVMRPLLQETTLPNLAYVGGGGELAYWLERKAQFAAFGVPFPVLVRRDSAWWLTAKQARRLGKLGLRPADLLGDEHALLRRYVTERAASNPELQHVIGRVRQAFADAGRVANNVEPTLEQRARAHGQRAVNALEALEKRLVRELKRQQHREVEAISALRAELLPGGGLQERRDSFLDLYARWGRGFFDALLGAFDPLDMRLKVFVEQR